MISIIDYGMGNLRSVEKAIEAVGGKARIISSAEDVANAERLVLPGVGAMRPAMERLGDLGLVPAIKGYVDSGRPFLGICLGLQLLFDSSSEGGTVQGLGILAGTVERFPSNVKVPQMGWNTLNGTANGANMLASVPPGSFVYFCHSYYVKPADTAVIGSHTEYGVSYASSVCVKNVWGVQFHPEKSQEVGLTILKNFIRL